MAVTQVKSPIILTAVNDEVGYKVPVALIRFCSVGATGVFELSDTAAVPQVLYRGVTTAAVMEVNIYVHHEWQDNIKVTQLPAGGLVFIHKAGPL